MSSLYGPFFEELPSRLQESLSTSGVHRSFGPGDTIFREEDPAPELFTILAGQVRVWRVTPQGAAVTAHILGPGDLAGVGAVLQRSLHTVTASAISAVKTLSWPADQALNSFRSHPEFAMGIVRYMASQGEEMLQRLHEVSTLPVEPRLARAVLRLAATSASIAVTRQELAELTATTLHTVSRIVCRWEADGIVEAARRRVTLLDAYALATRARWGMPSQS